MISSTLANNQQHIKKDFSMFVYDFKFDGLSRIVDNTWLKHKSRYAVPPEFFVINFDDLSRNHRCNPLGHTALADITDAAESARTILMASTGSGSSGREISLWNLPSIFDRHYLVFAEI